MHIDFGQFLTELWPLIDVRILFMLNILCIYLLISIISPPEPKAHKVSL